MLPTVMTNTSCLSPSAQVTRGRTWESLKIITPEGILYAAQVGPSWGPYDIEQGLQLNASCAVDWTAM